MDNVINNIVSDNNLGNTDQQNDVGSEGQYGSQQKIGTDQDQLNTGSVVNDLASLQAINQNAINRYRYPWVEIDITTVGQPFLEVGLSVYINDRVGGAVKVDDMSSAYAFIWRVIKIADDITSTGAWKTSFKATTNIEP